MTKHTLKYKNMRFLFHFDMEKQSHCSKCGTKVPEQPKLYVEGDTYKAAEYLPIYFPLCGSTCLR